YERLCFFDMGVAVSVRRKRHSSVSNCWIINGEEVSPLPVVVGQHADPSVCGAVWPPRGIDCSVPTSVSQRRLERIVVELFDHIEVGHHIEHRNIDPLPESGDMAAVDRRKPG